MNPPDFFTALFSERREDHHHLSVKVLPFDVLPPNDVLIKVHYSSLNYKDALSARGLNHVTREYPHIPGIDAAGEIVKDWSGTFEVGQEVIVTGYDMGTNTYGGFGEYIRVPADWVVAKPSALSLKECMIFGTAGFTAVYGIKRLQRELITPESGSVLVTGATGGVGSLAVFALAQLGYRVEAASRKTDKEEWLRSLGADSVIESDSLLSDSASPLLSRKWTGAIETVGGPLLDNVLRRMQDKGAVACCGNILGKELNTNVYPFILRGIGLLGIDSAFCVRSLREEIWDTISGFDLNSLPDDYYKTVSLHELEAEIDTILKGGLTGRVLITHIHQK